MIQVRDDFRRIASAFAVFVGAVAVAGALLIAGQRFLQKAILEESGAERVLDDARERVSRAKREQENLGKYQAAYRDLVKNRIVGEFNRLDLIEYLDEIGSAHFDMQYSISPQQEIRAPEFFTLQTDRVALHLSLLHEGRLLEFFDELKAKGLPVVEGCSIERMTEADNLNYEPHLRVSCTVTWVTLKASQ